MQLILQSETSKENLEFAVVQHQQGWKTFFCALENLESFFHK